MTYEDVLVLLKIVDFSRDHPQLKALHDQALAELAAVDPNHVGFASQMNTEPVED